MILRLSVLFLFLASVISTPVFATEAPELAAEKSVFDFGEVKEGVNVSVSFTVVNRGTGEARIEEIRTFAACVEKRPLDRQTLAPKESVTLEYIFQSLGYGNVPVNKHIEVHYNNKKRSPLKLIVKGNVLPLESHQAPIGELTYNFFVLIDIRSPEQYRKEHIIGAINVPLEKIHEWAAEVSESISDELIIYLYSDDGKKSDAAAKELRKGRFGQYISIVGGLEEWKNQLGKKFLITGKQ